MYIDFHTHIFPPHIRENPGKYVESDPSFATMYSSPKAKMISAEELVESMDREGIDVSVVTNIGWRTHELCVETNSYILEAIAKYPKRLVGFCTVQPLSLEAALSEIERCARAGARGIGEMRPDTQLLNTGDEEIMIPFISALVRNKLILLTHSSEPVGHQYPGKGMVTPGMLYPLITGFPDLVLVCAHWGGGLPFYGLMPEVKKAMANTYFDTAASPFLYSPRIYRQVSQIVGAEKILFGTDYPLMRQSRVIKDIRFAGLSPEEEELIFSGNARRLLNIQGE